MTPTQTKRQIHRGPARRGAAGAALLALAVLPCSSLSASDATHAFLKCMELTDDPARLACYDRLAAELVELGLPAEAAAAAPAAAARQAAPQAAPAPEQQFGLQERADADIESVTAMVVGGFNGWDGKTRFELDNGQVWEQSAPGRFGYGGPDRAVVIRRGMLNSFLLSPEGLNRSVRVQRIK